MSVELVSCELIVDPRKSILGADWDTDWDTCDGFIVVQSEGGKLIASDGRVVDGLG